MPEASRLALPSVPSPDPEALKEIQKSPHGKLLGRTAALLGLVVLLLGFVGLADLALRQWLGVDLSDRAGVRWGLLIGLPLLIVSFQLAAEWRARARAHALMRVAVAPTRAEARYFRIGPYQAEDGNAYARADGTQETG